MITGVIYYQMKFLKKGTMSNKNSYFNLEERVQLSQIMITIKMSIKTVKWINKSNYNQQIKISDRNFCLQQEFKY